MSKESFVIRPEEKIRLLLRENELLNSVIQGASDASYLTHFGRCSLPKPLQGQTQQTLSDF